MWNYRAFVNTLRIKWGNKSVGNFLGKLKDIIGGGQSDYQYYEQEMETMAVQDFESQETSEKMEYSSKSYTN